MPDPDDNGIYTMFLRNMTVYMTVGFYRSAKTSHVREFMESWRPASRWR